MSSSSSSPTDNSLLEKSSLYREFLAQREEILRHKWLKSEEEKRDIGFDAALVDWVVNYQAEWQKTRKQRPAGQ